MTTTSNDNYSADAAATASAVGVDVNNAGLALMTVLRNYGIDTIFGIPGTHNLELYRSLSALGIHPVTTRHEQGASYGSDGWSQQTGLPGVVITTSGPGLLNALSGAGTAYCESRPMILISPGVAEGSEFADNGALHETKDSTGAAGAIVEWSRRVTSATDAVTAVHDAFELFRYGRPRPVHIEIPLNVLESASDCPEELLRARPERARAAADAGAVERAAEILAAAAHPVIIAGGGASRIGSELTALAESLNAPVVTTLNGKASIPETHPLSLASEIRLPVIHELINQSDAVLIIGSKLGEAELWGGVIEPAGTVIRIDVLESQLNKNVASDLGLIGDSAVIVGQLRDALATRTITGNATTAAELDTVRATAVREAQEVSPTLHRVATMINEAIPENAIVAGDSSQITYFGMASVVRQVTSHSFLYTPAYATLGYGLPATLGAKVASPDRPVVCVLGDGALMFAVQEFITAIEQGLDVTIVCVDNGGYAEINQNERDRGITPVGVVLAQPNWSVLSAAFGGHGFSVTQPEQLTETVAQAIATPGFALVHVPLSIFEASDS
ncbi:acetolactate synthase-1/2/3 large subunit [Salinibacterium amurskyense]|uniref:Acetolactate synthase-1/2/3 large subunit n=1 Tax=Salinibacterium amurskyense TaxID=205941 RepID=A0A2M9D888_9MICO|nr:thiamine pyrophosphate-binding protein [Salinibacterium amurskyense]PJJ81934.1 acetolactate synthase-1/2/3 large subunit [Salinibacterium amurskyense]RLQ81725.1 thiamine pyrophosphate-binding protein [Salinibacterium amurskyense]GHD78775.1 putative 2-ketoarginine decarboxylase AruI [Salinibacterium amurskyense]